MQIFDDFNKIDSDDDVHEFVKQYGLTDQPTQPNSQILGIYTGTYNGLPVKVTHRWYDPSGPFSIQPDIHKTKIEIPGYGDREVSYEG